MSFWTLQDLRLNTINRTPRGQLAVFFDASDDADDGRQTDFL